MASSLLALIDDIATLLDDVAVLTKVAATNTAGVLGDASDLLRVQREIVAENARRFRSRDFGQNGNVVE